MKNISKSFGSTKANDKVNITLNKGEILSIVGENGAGKSTIMKILYGLVKPDDGEIYINEHEVRIKNPSDAIRHGIGMVQQHFMLFDSMSIVENIVFGKEEHKGIFYDKKSNTEVVKELSKKYQLHVDPEKIISDYPIGLQQRVEILKILYQNADIIIFDEPSAVLTPIEVDELLKTIRTLADMGKSIILITHKLHEVMAVADRVIVMRSGTVVGQLRSGEMNIADISYMMVGRQILTRKVSDLIQGQTLLEVKSLCLSTKVDGMKLNDVSIHVKEGEIVGIAGVSGNGQTELINCITGINTKYTGDIVVADKSRSNANVQLMRASGIAHIPEDRYVWGSAKEASLVENTIMGDEDSKQISSKGIFKSKNLKTYVGNLLEKYNVVHSHLTQKISELSGGNAQKLIIAREMNKKTPILIACEPTRGVDIGSMEFIHDKILAKRGEQGAVVLFSSELSEILSLSDRIYVIFEGEIRGEFIRGSVNERDLGLLMVGGSL